VYVSHVPNFVPMGQTAIFQIDGQNGRWICYTRVCTAHNSRPLFAGLCNSAKFACIRCSSFDNMQVFSERERTFTFAMLSPFRLSSVCLSSANPRAFQWGGQPIKSPFLLGRSEPPSTTWFIGSIRVSPSNAKTQTASRSVQPFLPGSRTWWTHRQTHRPTDRPRYSVCSNRPLSLANAAMSLIIIKLITGTIIEIMECLRERCCLNSTWLI